jgi:hypothetical protein
VILMTSANGGFDLDGAERQSIDQPDAEAVLERERRAIAEQKRAAAEERRRRAEERRHPERAQAEPGLDGPKPDSDPATAEAPELPQPSAPQASPPPAPATTPRPSPAPSSSGPVDPRFY